MEDKQEIMAFLYELPRSVKVIITTRERILSFPPIRLEQLSQEEAVDLIKKESDEKEVKISREQVLTLYRSIGGIPAALIYAIGQIASGFSLETVLGRIPKANSDVARFCFEGSLKPLRGKPAHHLLMAMAMFYKSPSRVALVYASGLTADLTATEEGLTQLWRLSLIREHNGRYTMLPLTREYALSELASNTSFEQQTRERWLEWYLNFTQDFGGKDWKDWYIRYDMIEEEWENLLAVFDWCAAHEQYDIVKTFWQEKHIVNFANIYGYWDDRLRWLDWLIQAAERRGDWSSGVKAMVDIGSTLTLIGQFDEADRHFKRAWERNKYVEPQIRLLLIQKIAELRIRQKDFIDASTLLDQAEALLDTIAVSIEEPNRTRRWADFQSRRGFLFYHMKDYDRARLWYEKMLSETKTINWDRTAIYAQNHLAYIAVHQGRLEDAEALLQTSLPANKDKRLAAFHKHVFAFFYQKKGATDEARRLAREALNDFKSLGMRQETKEMDDLLQMLEN
jgi:tetratricopeptide (TPR) repeat protein